MSSRQSEQIQVVVVNFTGTTLHGYLLLAEDSDDS